MPRASFNSILAESPEVTKKSTEKMIPSKSTSSSVEAVLLETKAAALNRASQGITQY